MKNTIFLAKRIVRIQWISNQRMKYIGHTKPKVFVLGSISIQQEPLFNSLEKMEFSTFLC